MINTEVKKVTKRSACEKWVNGLNAIPYSLIEKAYKDNADDLIELTPIKVGDRVWSNEYQGTYDVISINRDEEKVVIDVDGEEHETDIYDVALENDSWLPMWGWMWMFEERLDEDWARDNLDKMAECGFRVFDDEETGDIYIGIDGAGYDFYSQHWIPLYEARGLQWHNAE
jgi:hypothetical protein